MNINGQFFQNNAEFVTSRWTEASNGNDIYRQSRVGINREDPTYQLHISGDTNIENGVLYANGVKQWLDSYGIFKANSNTVAENITVPANVNCVSALHNSSVLSSTTCEYNRQHNSALAGIC